MPVRKYRRDTSEVSCCLKYVIFGFNVIFWLLGLGILAVGVWAWSEKDTFNNLSRLTNIALDPAFILILIGTVTFVIGFAGCVGALRENTCLLAAYAIFLAILLLLEMTVGVLGFVFKDSIKTQATRGFQAFITHYREDPDQQNLIDWIQEDWLQCCGIEGPKDWDRNNYFNCSSKEVGSREACGVPFSCCKRRPNEVIKNKQCGYDVRKPGYYADGWTNLSPTQPGERSIFERGCLRAGEEWVETNLVPVAGVAVGVAVLQNFDVGKIINERGCVQAGEEWLEHNLLIIACTAIAIAFLQFLFSDLQGRGRFIGALREKLWKQVEWISVLFLCLPTSCQLQQLPSFYSSWYKTFSWNLDYIIPVIMFAYLIVTGVLLLNRQQSMAEINSDGFNIYKDFLRTKTDEPYSFFDRSDEGSLYVYRAPSLVVVPDGVSGMDKRGVNHFKSLMLSPQRDGDLVGEDMPDKPENTIYHFPRVVVKREAPCKPPGCNWKFPVRNY